MNPRISQACVASYLAGVALGAGLLALVLFSGVKAGHCPLSMILGPCAGQVSSDQAALVRAFEVDVRAYAMNAPQAARG